MAPTSSTNATVLNTNFFEGLFKAYEAGLFTDLKIVCGDEEFQVHKIILSSQSKIFHAMCSNGFAESLSSTINLTTDGISLVSRMIHCLYRGAYDDFCATNQEDDQNWKSAYQLHAAMYALGDKYGMTVVKDAALANFKRHATKVGTTDLLGFLESIAIVYSSTPESERTLRDIVVEKIKAGPLRFVSEDVKEVFQKMVVEVPEFNWDLHQYWMTSFARESAIASKGRKR